MSPSSPSSRGRLAVLPLGVCALLLVVTAVKTAGHRRDTSASPAPATTASPRHDGAPGQAVARPLAVARRSMTHEWTAADAMSPQVIEHIAHNPDEFIKMVEENERIQARQLVYRNDTVAAVLQRLRSSGEPLRRITLPALDGREVEVEIDRADISPSWQSGSLTGRVAGRPASMVTLAFEFGTEAFTVLSPDDGLYLQADPREPGEVIVKRIDPATYAPGRCGNPDTLAGP